ncbi:MAG: J domain-containing protein [Chlamydiae bacterium]|nr:J domain-containing protein [Chlamydiota bacterium]
MTPNDALAILNIVVNPVTPEMITTAYRKAAMLYHPDRNPSSLEMMQLVNAAYDVLKDYTDVSHLEAKSQEYGEEVSRALNAICGLQGLEIEICGAWIWISGNTKEHKESLKAAGFRWGAAKKCWYFRPAEWKSKNRKPWSMNQIRDTYGSQSYNPEQENKKKLSVAA